MKKKILIGLIILAVGLWSNLGFAELSQFKPRSEPDGFRGIKWGTDISTLSDMEYYETDPSYGGTKVYTRKNEDLHLGAAKLERILYYFWRGKFCSVWVSTEGSTNWYGLQEAVFEKFGKGYQDNEFIEKYFWRGDITGMSLGYNEVSKEGELWMSSKEIYEQIKAYKKQKAKEGAEKGF